MVTCKCGKEFLTEADPHVIIPSPQGYLPNCGCYLTAENEKLKRIVKVYEDALKEIMGWLMRVFENPNHDLVRYIKNTLAQGAEIKKLFNKENSNVDQ